MNLKCYPNEPAAPMDIIHNDETREIHYGLTKREELAARFFAAMIANPAPMPADKSFVALAFTLADDFIAEANKETQ